MSSSESPVLTKIFITGSAGCIGHYLLDRFLGRPDLELHLLLRSKSRFKRDISGYDNVVIHRGDLVEIDRFESVLKQMDYVVHIATSWNNSDKAYLYNVQATLQLFKLVDRHRIKKIIYFSTSSVLGKGNRPLKGIEDFATGYIRSKAAAFRQLQSHPNADKVVTVFPTMVLGGDETHPFSHISEGLPANIRLVKWLRWFNVDVKFHFMHGRDYALMTDYLLFNDTVEREYVLGHPVVTAKELLDTVCQVYGIKRFFTVMITGRFVLALAKLLSIKMDKWSRYLLNHPHFEYEVLNPQMVGLKPSFSTLLPLVQDIKENAQFMETH